MAFCLDANVFIEAHRVRYPADVFPGFWEAILDGARRGMVRSIAEVYLELARGTDGLVAWAAEHRKAIFRPNDDEATQLALGEVYQAIDARLPRYTEAAKERFLRGADPWLVAWCLAHGHVLVTEEVNDPKATRRVALPGICRALGVESLNTLGLLRGLGVRFVGEVARNPSPTRKSAGDSGAGQQ